MRLYQLLRKQAMPLTFAISLIGMLGSLYYSEILHEPPCILCWYQRIALYPVVLISAIAFWTNDKNARRYIIGLCGIGALIGVYHNLLYYGVLPEKLGPCSLGVSCTTKYYELFGFLSIPLLSLLAFIFIIVLMLLPDRAEKTVIN